MRLCTNMGDNTKQVRVDNWGIFFLQRLQMFFSKTDYCDMTLQFEGNVQLKVHRLVMNACTEYFQFLEQTCTLDDNVIMMPSDLQADVIVPIVNFMYTGMLEFQLSIFDKLYKTAQVMNITILTKLLDAQKQSVSPAFKGGKKKHIESPQSYNAPAKKPPPKPSPHPELPATLPGRKIPVWKRKSIPSPLQPHSHGSSQLSFTDPKFSTPVDPLSLPDNTPKPTRFEWPDDDLPPLNPMDTSFEEISYTSRPLMTQEEEQRATACFDDLRHIPNASRSSTSSKKHSSPSLDMEEMKNYVKEQKIRSGLSQDEEVDDVEVVVEGGQKRKAPDQKGKGIVKKVRFDEQDNKTTTISIATDGKSGTELNHEKIVAEILKKYPQLVKKNKNIRLKIMAKNNKTPNLEAKVENIQLRAPRMKVTEVQKVSDSPKASKPREIDVRPSTKAPWICERCSTDEEIVEFVLYYLYRKHMTDVHGEKFDPRLCKYCGHRCNKHNLLMYHLYTKHGMKPPSNYSFPKCDRCPFIALSPNILSKHKSRHGKNEIQCPECKLAFTSQATLTSHVQITGHTGKTNKNNYDCQYCTKRFQSGVNLFAHVRLQHKNEGVRDGIVSIEEIDDIEECEEEDQKDEYILPEIIADPEPEPTRKVNILSNVKVQDRQEHTRHQQMTLEPSSEAEALNNVATGIATSLGLVDIVVLNDNQQIFLQSNQQNFSNDQNEQPEFILPELTRDSYGQNQNEIVTTDGVITQQMLSSGDIGSTDELVMVLTDHDYGDNQEEMNNENSNIVVLYSHPVDGQQDQFITSQGNLMVNSQGMLEIRNGATITSTANQVVVNPQETHIESIEMIQREIESHQELKQELYEEEKPIVDKDDEQLKETEVVVVRNDPLIESLTQGEQLEFTSPLVPAESATTEENGTTEDKSEEIGDNPVNTEEESGKNEDKEEEMELEKEVEEIQTVQENATVGENTSLEENPPVEENLPVEEVQPQAEETEETEAEKVEESFQQKATSAEANVDEEKESESVAPEENLPPVPEDIKLNCSEEAEPITGDSANVTIEVADEDEETEITEENEEGEITEVNEAAKITEENEEAEVEEENKEVENKEETVEENPPPPPPAPPVEEPEKEDTQEPMEMDEEPAIECVEEEKNAGEATVEQELSQSDTSTSQSNDENSQSSQDSQHKENQQENVSTKISILDDWEDTDSQQSDKEKAKVAGETVHKLMDDWEEEDEDENRKEVEVE